MAGVKGRSGRKSKAEELGGDAIRERSRVQLKKRLGKLGSSEPEIVKYLDRLDRAYIDGLSDDAMHKRLVEAANVKLRAMARVAARTELERWEKVLERAEQLEGAGAARAAAERQIKH